MKNTTLLPLAFLGLFPAFDSVPAAAPRPTNAPPPLPLASASLQTADRTSSPARWQAARRRPHQTEWVRVERATNTLTGQITESTRTVIELGTGLNRREATCQWVAADPSFELTRQGAVARGDGASGRPAAGPQHAGRGADGKGRRHAPMPSAVRGLL